MECLKKKKINKYYLLFLGPAGQLNVPCWMAALAEATLLRRDVSKEPNEIII